MISYGVFDPSDIEVEIDEVSGAEIITTKDRFEGLLMIFLIFASIMWGFVKEPPIKDQVLLDKS